MKINDYNDIEKLLIYGNYHTQLEPFVQVFGLDKINFIDGSRMANSFANAEVERIEDYLGVNPALKFKFNETKKFMCLSHPVQFCLNGSKGRPKTMDFNKVLKKEISILRDYYRLEMKKIFNWLLPDLKQNDFCMNKEHLRFSWLGNYLC